MFTPGTIRTSRSTRQTRILLPSTNGTSLGLDHVDCLTIGASADYCAIAGGEYTFPSTSGDVVWKPVRTVSLTVVQVAGDRITWSSSTPTTGTPEASTWVGQDRVEVELDRAGGDQKATQLNLIGGVLIGIGSSVLVELLVGLVLPRSRRPSLEPLTASHPLQ